MSCNSNVVVPELLQDECKGCLTTTDCINTVEVYPSLGINETTKLTNLIEVLVDKIDNLEAKILILESNL